MNGLLRLHGVALGLLLAAGVAVGCTSPAATCVPECRSGFTCVRGGCVSACNPPCASGEVCYSVPGGATCARPDAASGTDASTDAVVAMDAPANTDAPVATDTVTPPDGATMDTPVAPDAPRADAPAADAPPPCGRDGEACCGSPPFVCLPGNVCASGRCRAFTPMPGECSRPADCAATEVCAGPQVCGDHECFRCAPRPDASGALPFGADCTVASMCATGVCQRGHCTTACAVGTTGDADCAREGAGYICGQVTYTVGPMGMTTTTAIGYCRRGCARNADCTAPETCIPQLNYVTDTMDWVCGRSAATGTAGAPCTDGSSCQAFLCIPSGMGGAGNCTAPCVTAADCPAAAPFCSELYFVRPLGGTQVGRGCTVTRM